MPLTRSTRETTVTVDIRPGTGEPKVAIEWTAQGGIDEGIEPELASHFFHSLLRYMGMQGTVSVNGDLAHHVIEDLAIVIGRRLKELAGPTITRYGDRTIPMDDALVMAVIDMGGRPHYHSDLKEVSPLWDHVLRTIAFESTSTLHVIVIHGHDPHHVVEGALKAVGSVVRDALTPSERVESTKGTERAGAATGRAHVAKAAKAKRASATKPKPKSKTKSKAKRSTKAKPRPKRKGR